MNPDWKMEGNSHGGGGGVDARLEERTEDGSDVRGGRTSEMREDAARSVGRRVESTWELGSFDLPRCVRSY